MALNPKLGSDNQPLRHPNERDILEVTGVEFEVNIDKKGKYKGKGRLVVTSLRLVLINDRGKKGPLKVFELPLILLYKVDFKQPFFRANYYTGMCKPLPESELPSDPVFKIWFNHGNTERFLKTIEHVIKQVRNKHGVRQGTKQGAKQVAPPQNNQPQQL